MPSHVWTPKENGWHGSNGVTLICHGIKQNFGLAIYPRMGELEFLFLCCHFPYSSVFSFQRIIFAFRIQFSFFMLEDYPCIKNPIFFSYHVAYCVINYQYHMHTYGLLRSGKMGLMEQRLKSVEVSLSVQGPYGGLPFIYI